MNRPKILDAYCCQGGAGMGYHQAGFDVYGIDKDPQPRYPFALHQGDVITALATLLTGGALDFHHRDGRGEWLTLADFVAAHTSPPCQAYSITRHTHQITHPELMESTREGLIATGLPYVIENVVGAPLLDPLMLCGSEFDLTATDTDGTPLRLERHRLFESNVFLLGAGGCRHNRRIQVAGAYGGGSSDRRHAREVRRGGYTPTKAVRSALLGGVDWMTMHGQAQAVPPAYTEFIGAQVLDHLSGVGSVEVAA
jgi:DNA (cytosine-5)-methyltransferase 1